MKFRVLSGLILMLPKAGFAKLAAVTDSSPAPLSTSVSLANTSMLFNAVLIGVTALSSTATGASLTALTLRVSVPTSLPPLPSMTV